MAGLKKKRRIQMIVIGMVLLAVSSGLIGFALRDGIEFFRSPTQVVENRPSPNERFRIGGLVEIDSVVRGEGEAITFVVTDGNEMVDVSFIGILPDLFGEGQGVVATGKLIGDVFEASEILAKHDEEYMPKEVIDALKEQGIYADPEGS
jgi:cytochrome c-type biogenesis protein CcmE